MVGDGSQFKIHGNEASRLSASRSARQSTTPGRDFEKVLGREEREGRERDDKKDVQKEDKDIERKGSFEEVAEQLESQEMQPKARGVSLFDLAGKKTEEAAEASLENAALEELKTAGLSSEVLEESLSALFKGYGTKEKLQAMQQEVSTDLSGKNPISFAESANPASGRLEADPLAELSHVGQKSGTPVQQRIPQAKFSQEAPPDLASINPLAASEVSAVSPALPVEQTSPVNKSAQLKEIIDQIIDKLYTIEKSGKTDTLVKLRHPPLFAGASVVISSFASAKGEFNITFENLTQAAKQLLELKENQEGLKFALEQKGYTVHIITSTTLSETTDLIEGKREEEKQGEKGGDSSQSQSEEQES